MKELSLVVDMYGCPNRCKHCWLGHMPNRKMADKTDEQLIEYFKPYFENITYYSWLREPDYCDDYRQRWMKDNEISIQGRQSVLNWLVFIVWFVMKSMLSF